MERTKVAFIFVTEDANPVVNHSLVFTPGVEFHTVGVPDFASGAAEAAKFSDAGFVLIELCAGFGEEGTALVVDAVRGKTKVGACSIVYEP